MDKSRFTVDLNNANRYTERFLLFIPSFNQEHAWISGTHLYATFNVSDDFWQLPVHAHFQTFLWPDSIYSSTTDLDGTANAVISLRYSLTNSIFINFMSMIFLCSHSFMILPSSLVDPLSSIQPIFEICTAADLILLPQRFVPFAFEIRWGGRGARQEDVCLDPHLMDTAEKMSAAVVGATLQTYECAVHPMRSAVSSFFDCIRCLFFSRA